MDEDFIIDETNPFKVIVVVLLFIGIIGGGILFYLNYQKQDHVKVKDITVELGDKLPLEISAYAKGNNLETYKLDLSQVKVDDNNIATVTGEYSYRVIKNDKILKGKIYVKDTKAPIFTLENLEVGVNENFSPNDYILTCDDYSLPCSVKFKNAKDLELNSKEGVYDTTIIISDAEGNEVSKKVKLTVKGENTLLNKKSSDLEFSYLEEKDKDWDNTYTIKLDKAIDSDSIKYNDYINELGMKEYDFNKKVAGKKILVAYNKYHFVIGFSIKVNFEDGSYIFVNKGNAKEKVADDTPENNEEN